jgi:hypothetical protein
VVGRDVFEELVRSGGTVLDCPQLAVTWVDPEGESSDLGVFTIVPDLDEVTAPPPEPDGGWRLLLRLRTRPGGNGFTGMNTLGRATNNDLIVEHRQVSKFHAYLRQMGGKWTVHDANSLNGTWVDGRRAPPERGVPLRDGAELIFGNGAVRALFLSPEAVAAKVAAAR